MESFWDFSLRHYGGMQEVLLRLQDEAELNVNLLLFCGWLGVRGIRLHDMQEAVAVVQEWDSYIVPLRELRRRVKNRDDKLYEKTKELELHYEKACQFALQNYADMNLKKGGENCVAENLHDYIAFADKDKAWIRQALCVIGDRLKN